MNTMHTINFNQITTKQTRTSNIFRGLQKTLLVISIYVIFGLLFHYVYADTDIDTNVDPYQTQHGSVWLLPDSGIYLEALQMQTDVYFEITGPIVRARIKQKFKNTGEFWAEGIYVFPLPEKAAVDTFKMFIGERVIEGQIKERTDAKKIYDKAKAAGKKTSLIEQQRPNIFTTSLANIAPGEEITIEFEYQQLLDYQNEQYRLRYPMVVGPRYNANTDGSTNMTRGTSVHTETDFSKNTNNPTRIHILLDSGVNLVSLDSRYHKIHIIQTSETRYSISTTGENIIANRDFELVWQPELTEKPQLTTFNESLNNGEINNENYIMVTLLPPDLTYLEQKIQARDIIFVVDVSGSMAGTSIKQAKAALITALDNLSSIDRFNIIWFNNNSDSLYPTTVDATSRNKDYAKQFVNKLRAEGGTEMLPALKLSLANQQEFSRLRQVIFLTDGNINNEAELFNLIDNKLGESRLFTVGIGSAPNSYFMRTAANKERGSFTYIGDINEVHKKTTALFKKLETPALINIQLSIDGDISYQTNYEMFPKKLPDLYSGEPLRFLLKGTHLPGSISVKGDYANSEWQTSAQLTSTSQSGISTAWAREKIVSLMHQRQASHPGEERISIKQEVTQTALQHHLVSAYTSLVAVDITPSNTEGMLYQERMKNNLPHGWKKPTTSNGLMLAQTATASELNLLLAFVFFILATFLYLRKKSLM